MSLSVRLRTHLRHNVVGYVALFCFAIGGMAQALPGKNAVDSGDIKKAQVKRSDLARNSVNGSKVVDNSLKGADVDESSLVIPQAASLPPSGPAGGDLAATYPNPEVQESGLVPGGDLSGSLANAQVSEGGLAAGGDLGGPLSNAQIGGGVVGDAEIADGTVREFVGADEIGGAAFTGSANPPDLGAIAGFPAILFDQTTDEDMTVTFRAPDNFVSGGQVGVDILTTSSASGLARIVDDVDTISPDTTELVTATSGVTSGTTIANLTANRLRDLGTSGSAGPVEPGDLLRVDIARNASNAGDTLPADVAVLGFGLQFQTRR